MGGADLGQVESSIHRYLFDNTTAATKGVNPLTMKKKFSPILVKFSGLILCDSEFRTSGIFVISLSIPKISEIFFFFNFSTSACLFEKIFFTKITVC